MLEGVILKGIGGFYYIDTETGVYECRARGIFRKEGIRPTVGDAVRISVLDEEGVPTIVEQAGVLPPRSSMQAATAEEIRSVVKESPLAEEYNEAEDRRSAYEVLEEERAEEQEREEEEAKQAAKEKERAAKRTTSRSCSCVNSAGSLPSCSSFHTALPPKISPAPVVSATLMPPRAGTNPLVLPLAKKQPWAPQVTNTNFTP